MKCFRSKSPLALINKLGIILVLIVIMPALIYTAYEFNSLNENEKLIADIYKQQLDAILFSVNQYAWDYINNWVVEVERGLVKNDLKYLPEEILNDKALLNMAEIDSSFFHYIIVSNKSNISAPELGSEVLAKLKNQDNLYVKLKDLKKQGYKKIEAIILNEDKVIFVFIPDYAVNYEKLIYILARSQSIIQIITQKLDEIASDQFKVGIFKKDNPNPIYSNETFLLSEVKQTKNIWIFPNYFLGISLKGESIESVIRSRFLYSLALILFVDVLMLAGLWMIFRSMKKEMELTKLKTDFVSNVSHELRTPLSLIRMYAETLEMDRVEDDNKKHSYYQVIYQESERLTRLINNILNFSRIESGQKQYNFTEVNLNSIVNKIIEMYGFHLQSEGFDLNIKISEDELHLTADEEALSEALINLIDNAIKYSNEKKEITISTGKQNGSVFLEVSDSGIGINKENQKYIFDKFYRVSAGSTFTKKGSGLGLSLVKHIMDAHNGKILVNSMTGKGSTFRLIFNDTKE